MGRFIEPCWIEVKLMEGKRPFQGSRRPRVAKWNVAVAETVNMKFSFAGISALPLGFGPQIWSLFAPVLFFHSDPEVGPKD